MCIADMTDIAFDCIALHVIVLHCNAWQAHIALQAVSYST